MSTTDQASPWFRPLDPQSATAEWLKHMFVDGKRNCPCASCVWAREEIRRRELEEDEA